MSCSVLTLETGSLINPGVTDKPHKPVRYSTWVTDVPAQPFPAFYVGAGRSNQDPLIISLALAFCLREELAVQPRLAGLESMTAPCLDQPVTELQA